jgi:cell wall-associated NlpC family hydrolase
VATAKGALGKPYVKGGTGPDGFDTSGFIRYCFREHDITVPRSTGPQFEDGLPVEKEDLQPGDVVFFYLENPGKAEYVGIYSGNNLFIAVSTSENAVLERKLNTNYYKEHYIGARRYVPTESENG